MDPELHLLRSVARRCEDARTRQEVESARFALFAAFEQGDRDGAARWSRALRVAVEGLEPRLCAVALEALDEIDRAIGESRTDPEPEPPRE